MLGTNPLNYPNLTENAFDRTREEILGEIGYPKVLALVNRNRPSISIESFFAEADDELGVRGERYIDVLESRDGLYIRDKRVVRDLRGLPHIKVTLSRFVIHTLDGFDKGSAYVAPVMMTIARGDAVVNYTYDDVSGTFDHSLDSIDKPIWDHYAGSFIAHFSDVDTSIDDFANQGE